MTASEITPGPETSAAQSNETALNSALKAVRSYSDNPSAFLALNTGNSYFTAPGLAGVIAYRESGRWLVQFGGPFAPEGDYRELLGRFRELARERRRRIVAIQLQRADANAYAEQGFTVNQVGASYAVELESLTLRGTKFMRLRNKISRAHRSGLKVTETDADSWADALAAIDRSWLRAKGRHAKQLEFLVGERGGAAQEHRRLFVGLLSGEPIGYISYSPVYGNRPGWMHDLSRRLPEGPPGIMEAINKTAIDAFGAEKAAWLHFGFTPFTSLDLSAEVAGASSMVSRIMRLLRDHGSVVYPATTQLAYKEKWGPHVVLPEYLAFSGRPSLGGIWRILRVTNSI